MVSDISIDFLVGPMIDISLGANGDSSDAYRLKTFLGNMVGPKHHQTA